MCADLADRGVDSLPLASHYHSIRSLDARHPEDLFDPYPGGCYFDPDVVPDEATFGSLVDAVRAAVDGTVSVSHYRLMTDAHLDWLAGVFGR